jgi:hypothetical protein
VPGNFPSSLTDTEKKKKTNERTNKQRSGQCPETARTDGQTDRPVTLIYKIGVI